MWFSEFLMWQPGKCAAQICCRGHRSLTDSTGSISPRDLPLCSHWACASSSCPHCQAQCSVGTSTNPFQQDTGLFWWATLGWEFHTCLVQVSLSQSFSPSPFTGVRPLPHSKDTPCLLLCPPICPSQAFPPINFWTSNPTLVFGSGRTWTDTVTISIKKMTNFNNFIY